MIAALGRIKRAVREAIGLCGGVDGAGMTAGRNRSVAGDWNNLNHDAFPPLGCALALDEVCIAKDGSAPILSAYAAELGHVAIALPAFDGGLLDLTDALIDASAEFGDISSEIRTATRDQRVCCKDRDLIVPQIDECVAALVRLRAIVNAVPAER